MRLHQGANHSLGVCSDGELNPKPSGLDDDTANNWAAWPGEKYIILFIKMFKQGKNQEAIKFEFWG